MNTVSKLDIKGILVLHFHKVGELTRDRYNFFFKQNKAGKAEISWLLIPIEQVKLQTRWILHFPQCYSIASFIRQGFKILLLSSTVQIITQSQTPVCSELRHLCKTCIYKNIVMAKCRIVIKPFSWLYIFSTENSQQYVVLSTMSNSCLSSSCHIAEDTFNWLF